MNRTYRSAFVLGVVIIAISYQNCAKTSFAPAEGVFTSSSFNFSDTTSVETKMNTPVEFTVQHSEAVGVDSMEFKPEGALPLNGTFEIKDLGNFKLKYTPNFGFRGRDTAKATARDKSGNQIDFYVVVNVGNSLSDLEPALVIRGMGCVQCHANLNSNVVTDFGYGNDYYFGAKPGDNWWQSGGIYGDHGQNFDTMTIPTGKSVIVPAAKLPSIVASTTGTATLAGYIQKLFKGSAIASTRQIAVTEKASVYIGAPTAAQIIAGTRLGANERFRYYKNALDSVELAGLSDQGKFFQAVGNLNCDGDLVVRGPLYLENLNLRTTNGCRIYVIGSVFMYGPLKYVTTSANNNLQITSSASINMGLGLVRGSNGTTCDVGGRYAVGDAGYGDNSLVARLATFWTVPGNYVRGSNDPAAYGRAIVAEADVIQATRGVLPDAACRAEGRKVSFEHLLLNAPIIHSRYEGNFKGTVIAEFSIMSLGAFVFEFDPVFKQVPVWPFLDSRTYLHIE